VQLYQQEAKSNAYYRQSRVVTEKRLLQIAILFFGFVPVLAGLAGMVRGITIIANARDVSLDSADLGYQTLRVYGVPLRLPSELTSRLPASTRSQYFAGALLEETVKRAEKLSFLVHDDVGSLPEAALRYCRGVDRLDAGLMLSAYHDGATDDHGETPRFRCVGSPKHRRRQIALPGFGMFRG